ncbi:23S rRNA (uracil(1939)-C(5))-methyltransferase RlmD [Diplocloster agilis]|uniref:23S rRNA (uracil(1939)-C(5))-methyltransferase RlmD n=1 Tax=Diplocloster agilis TaxID=2850323 RepID=UPI00082285FC|nr:23S rRNA (uracil(1939)-C(5))-methyltransferase RlmD [Suonthocola fibrivorans]MCU6732128.1 23S rRNA (uracil(1939)-C(5))-methyltransferase RlmD [Suonthocola fibrivorans]SCI34417.1 23S rRNA (uracil-C(5))-methyltransferase RlmCD [uncultured Clostridium sp.]
MVQKNEIYQIRIEDMTTEGDGIGKVDGYPLFVKGALTGDLAEVKVIKAKKTYGYGRLVRVLEPSAFRVTPECAVSGPCGGCQLQAMSYEEQLRFKENKIRNNLLRIGKLNEVPMLPIMGMEEPFRYRNKAQFPIGMDKEGNPVAGFYAGRTHSIVPVRDCRLGVEENQEILDVILGFMKEYGIPAYEEEKGTGLVRHVLIRYGFRTGEIMVCIVINGKSLPHGDVLADRLRKIGGMTSISLNVNRKRTNVILGTEMVYLWGAAYITDYIGDVEFRISPLSFYQVNPVQTRKLYEKALEFAGLNGGETVWDLYCGIGTISLFLAQKAGKVYGVEIVPEAIEDARMNAKLNGIENAEFFVGKAEEVLPAYYERNGGTADVVVVDPPRKGCDQAVLDTIARMKVGRVVYVSCDSATLARDVKYMEEQGYRVEKVQGCDMFPFTVHVETIVLLSKLKSSKHIEVELKMDELDLTAAESKATYEEIKDYVLEHSGMKVSSLYIAQVKQKCGIIERTNYNQPKSEDSRQPKCPPEKEVVIREALEHFRMI